MPLVQQREVSGVGKPPIHPPKACCFWLSPSTPLASLAECLTEPQRWDLCPPQSHIQERKPSLLLSDLPETHRSEKKELGFEVQSSVLTTGCHTQKGPQRL